MAEPVSPIGPKTGLILTGGGARAAYQVGVLRAIAEILPKNSPNPFPIICGTSAGAINATALAIYANDFRKGVKLLVSVWRNFQASHVYRSDPGGVLGCGLRWVAAILVGGLGEHNPVALLDNTPLRSLLKYRLAYDRIDKCIESGDLYALSITASGYNSGQSVSFYQGAPEIMPWKRARRIGCRGQIGSDHLMASSAIPFIFPATRVNREYFGDGSMRQIAPISPALHLGAERVLVIGAGRINQSEPIRTTGTPIYPSLAQIAGHALNSIFLDSLEVDLERLQRMNDLIEQLPAGTAEKYNMPLRKIEVMLISPSEPIDQIAARHARHLPPAIRFLLRGLGALKRNGSDLVSYLLFEKPFCRAMIALGYRDTMARRDEVAAFLRVSLSAAEHEKARKEFVAPISANS